MRPESLNAAHPMPPGAAGAAAAVPRRTDWATLGQLLPYLWAYRGRVLLALACLVVAKAANVAVPLLLKQLVDSLSISTGDPRAVLVVPVGLLLAYGALRLSTSLFTELRELVFAKATEGASRSISLQVFQHLHSLSLRFHLERQTGGMTRDIERGTRGVQSLISYSLYSILPTLVEVGLVLTLLAVRFDAAFAWITGAALVVYIAFTISVTEWRTKFRRQMNELDSTSHSKAIDSLLNYETVKYFNNEGFEAKRYDESLERLRRAKLKSQTTLSMLNTGQQLLIAGALIAMLWRATEGVVAGRMTLGGAANKFPALWNAMVQASLRCAVWCSLAMYQLIKLTAGGRGPVVSFIRKSLPTAMPHGMSTIFDAARKKRWASRVLPFCSSRLSATLSRSAVDIPWPYTGLKLQIASPKTSRPSGNSLRRS